MPSWWLSSKIELLKSSKTHRKTGLDSSVPIPSYENSFTTSYSGANVMQPKLRKSCPPISKKYSPMHSCERHASFVTMPYLPHYESILTRPSWFISRERRRLGMRLDQSRLQLWDKRRSACLPLYHQSRLAVYYSLCRLCMVEKL